MTSEAHRFALKHGDHFKSVITGGGGTHPSLLHGDNSSLSTLAKYGGKEGSFTITSWRAAWAVFSAAHVLARVLTTREEEAVNTVHKSNPHSYIFINYCPVTTNYCFTVVGSVCVAHRDRVQYDLAKLSLLLNY